MSGDGATRNPNSALGTPAVYLIEVAFSSSLRSLPTTLANNSWTVDGPWSRRSPATSSLVFVTIISAIAELERSLVVERVKSGMRRARLEGRTRSGNRLDVDRQQVIQDRRSGVSLTQVANKHGLSRASVCPLMKEAGGNSVLPVSLDGANIAEETHV